LKISVQIELKSDTNNNLHNIFIKSKMEVKMETKVRKVYESKKVNEFKIRFDFVSKTNFSDKQIYLNCSYNGISFRYYSGFTIPKENIERERLQLSNGVQYVCRIRKNTFNKEKTPATEINRRMELLKLAAYKVYEDYFKGDEKSFNRDSFIKYLQIELGEYNEPKANENNGLIVDKSIGSDLLKIKSVENINLNLANIEIFLSKDEEDRLKNPQVEKKDKELKYLELIKEDLNDATNIFFWYHQYAAKMKVSDNRRRHYHADIARLKVYSNTLTEPLSFDNIDLEDYFDYLDDGKRVINTRVSIMKRLRAFFRHCRLKFKVIRFNPFEEIIFSEAFGSELYGEPICMKREELTKLYEHDFRGNSHCELVRDMFCLQASIGCRVGDFLGFGYDNIENGILSYFAHKTRDKSLTKINVPLSARAKEIIKKYKNKKIRDRYKVVGKDDLLMPFINAVEYNETLKDVFEAANLKRKVVVYNREERTEEIFKLCDLATSHLARRTFIDVLFQAGESLSVIASMSGHTENSRALARYKTQPEGLKKKAVLMSMD